MMCTRYLFAILLHSMLQHRGSFSNQDSLFHYQVSLTTFYYLTVCRNWKEERGFKKYQWAFHAPPIIWGVSTALYGAIDDRFNPALIWCFFTE